MLKKRNWMRLSWFTFRGRVAIFVFMMISLAFTTKLLFTSQNQNIIWVDRYVRPSGEFVHLPPDVTVVTGYMNLGKFQKGLNPEFEFTPKLYTQWMDTFAFMENPVAAFFDDDQYLDAFKSLRNKLPQNLTKTVKVYRNKTWAFKLFDRINSIFSDPDYPKYHPNTVYPEYSIVMHLKYELMEHIVLENPFNTHYFAWVDIGYFRSIVLKKVKDNFILYIPPGLNKSCVAYNMIDRETYKEWDSVGDLLRSSRELIAGGLFIAQKDVMLAWTRIYMHYVERFLKSGYMNTDQLVLYAMLQKSSQLPSQYCLQFYTGRLGGDKWMHLGYLCREAGERHRANLLNYSFAILNPQSAV